MGVSDPPALAMKSPANPGIRLRDQLIKAAKGSVILRIVSLASTFATSVVLARALGPEHFGIYSYVFAIITLLALPSQVGIPTLLVRETAKAEASANWSVLRGLWRWSTRVILVTSFGTVAAALLYLLLRWNAMDVELRATFLAGTVLIPLVALGNARGAALRGLRRIVAGQLPETVIRPLLLVGFVGAAWTLHRNVTAASAMAWHVLAAAIAFAVGAVILRRVTPQNATTAVADVGNAPAWRKAVVPLALISGLQVAGNQAGVVLLGWFRPEAEVGFYKVAASGATLALFGLQTANLILAPHIARLHSLGDHARLQRLAAMGSIASAVLTLPVFLAFLFGGPWLLGIVYGAAYVDAYAPLVILCAGQMVNALFGSVGLLLNMTGNEGAAARWLGIAAVCNVGLGLLLIPGMGMLGAALASVTSIVVWNIAFWSIAKKRLGVDGSVLAALRRGWRK